MEVIMKALKFSLIAMFLSLFVVGFADNDPQPKFQKSCCIKISLEDACASRSFVRDIYNQVNPSILDGGDQGRLIFAKVRHGRGIYLVFGKYAEWQDFFFREGGMLGPPDIDNGDKKY
jgi:hypothetical protein